MMENGRSLARCCDIKVSAAAPERYDVAADHIHNQVDDWLRWQQRNLISFDKNSDERPLKSESSMIIRIFSESVG
jgi:hypothetical protein